VAHDPVLTACPAAVAQLEIGELAGGGEGGDAKAKAFCRQSINLPLKVLLIQLNRVLRGSPGVA
jgi:hypothetical protein